MKKLSILMTGVAALAISTAGLAGGQDNFDAPAAPAASTTGIYVGGNLGYGYSNFKKFSGVSTKTKRNGLVLNADAGYKFNQNIAVELGYTHFANATRSNGAISDKFKSFQAVDAAVKGIYPFNDQFDVFAKAGVAYVHVKQVRKTPVLAAASQKFNRITPLFAVGADYNLNSNVAVTVQGQTTLKSKQIPATYAGLVGLTYTFQV